jgi:hypothetical protein
MKQLSYKELICITPESRQWRLSLNANKCHFEDVSILKFILKIFVCFDLQRTWLNNHITLAVSR